MLAYCSRDSRECQLRVVENLCATVLICTLNLKTFCIECQCALYTKKGIRVVDVVVGVLRLAYKLNLDWSINNLKLSACVDGLVSLLVEESLAESSNDVLLAKCVEVGNYHKRKVA